MTGSYIEEEAFSEQPEDDSDVVQTEDSDDADSGQTENETSDEPKELPDILPEYQEIYAENEDLVGWLQIDGTVINYPVLQSDSEEDSQFYLTHSFAKKKDKNGSLFMDCRNDFVDRDTNIIIHGHNMKSGAMFGTLKNYLEQDYLEKEAILFSGDTLFQTSYGRGDFPTGNAMDMLASVKKLLTLPENVIVYPGHMGETTIAHEKKYNPLARY